MPVMLLWLRAIRTYLTGNFHCNEFAYIVYPFARIYKLLGFAPIQLRRGDILRNCAGKQLQWDTKAWAWTCFHLVVYTISWVTLEISVNQVLSNRPLGLFSRLPVKFIFLLNIVIGVTDCLLYAFGFSVGICQLHSKSHNRFDGISHWTSWAQLFTLFILSIVAWVTAWTHMDEQCQLCALVFKIDKQLREFAKIEFDYKLLRKRLFYQLGLELLIAFPLSMVNCMIIQPTTTSFLPITACYWFICVAPISLLIFKQFQFYNQMYILKTKFELINCKLSRFNRNGVFAMAGRRILTVRKINSVSEIPLTAVPISAPHNELVAQEEPNVEILQNLLMIYSSISDGIDLVLRIFAWHLLCITAVSFGVITIQSYNLFILMTHSLALPTHHVFFIIAWILVQVMAIAVNVRICSSTSRTMDATVSLLHKIRCPPNEAPNACVFYQILQLFSMEVLQRKRNFNAAGFFDMDYKLITSIFASVTTYLVIIIQFHFTSVPVGHFANHSVY